MKLFSQRHHDAPSAIINHETTTCALIIDSFMTLVIDIVTLMIFKSTVNDVSVTCDTITDYAIKPFSEVHCSLSSL